MRIGPAAGVVVLLSVSTGWAQQPQGAPVSAGAPQSGTPGRHFTAPVGVIFNSVRRERVDDFEAVIGYLEAALARSTDPVVQAQARGWRVFRASEPGPDGAVPYVFLLDPAVADADYGLGRILAEAYPDPLVLTEIWRLYSESVMGGGSLLNLTPVDPPEPDPALAVPPPRMLPPSRER